MSDSEMVSADKGEAQTKKDLTVQGDNKNATFSFQNEDHTLGNLLRNQIVKNKHVEFCAYSVPHPSEPVCNVRVQVSESAQQDIDANTVLKHGLKRINKICDILTEKFEQSLKQFQN